MQILKHNLQFYDLLLVFHASQIDGLPALPEQKTGENAAFERHQAAERLLTASNAKIFHDQMNSAFYRPSTDEIHLPEKGQFRSPDGYYATALHELGHWTGHESRLNRQLLGNPFGSAEYAREELRTKIASYMLGMELDIGTIPASITPISSHGSKFWRMIPWRSSVLRGMLIRSGDTSSEWKRKRQQSGNQMRSGRVRSITVLPAKTSRLPKMQRRKRCEK